VVAYKSERASALNALVNSGSPVVLADQLAMLDGIAKEQRVRIADVAALKARYDAEKKPLDALVAKLAAQETQLAAQEKSINADIANLNALRLQAYGSSGGTGVLRPTTCPVAYDGSAGARAAKVACQQIGKSYVFGTDGPGHFDCSGLTGYAWRPQGVTLRHYTMWQWQGTTHISRAQLRPGDLVFMYPDKHHVGIYVGGEWLVHAPKAGDVVRMAKLNYGIISGYARPA
jgi:cell wall-associated NlpC family hydrolase